MINSYQEAERMLRETTLEKNAIAEATGLSCAAVRRMQRRLELREDHPECRKRCERENEAYERKKETAKTLLRQRMKKSHVASETGLSRAVVATIARQLDVRAATHDRQSYVYGLQCPDSKQFYYVGVSVQPWVRYRSHLSATHNDHAAEWIAALKKEGLVPLLVIIERVSEAEQFAAETRWIYSLSHQCHPLVNYQVQQ